MEVLVKRRMLIEWAYQGRPDAPSWVGAEHFMGFEDAENGALIDPECTKYHAARMKEEVTILREQRLKRDEDKELAALRKQRFQKNDGDEEEAGEGPKPRHGKK